MKNQREQNIETIIRELEGLKRYPECRDKLYAIEANINFYRSLKSIWSYLKWLVRVAPKLDSKKLLEINDLLPQYDSRMHNKLLKMERKIPGLVGLIVKKLTGYITEEKRSLYILNVGSGSMESERQVIRALIKLGNCEKIVFVGIDQSDNAHESARINLKEYAEFINVFHESELTKERVETIKNNSDKKYIVIQIKNDALSLQNCLGGIHFDIAFHTLFRHHLSEEQKNRLDLILKQMSRGVLEYDGFRDMISVIPQSIIGWLDPIFLNAEIFSNLRFMTKEQVSKRKISVNGKLSLSQIGYYLLEY